MVLWETWSQTQMFLQVVIQIHQSMALYSDWLIYEVFIHFYFFFSIGSHRYFKMAIQNLYAEHYINDQFIGLIYDLEQNLNLAPEIKTRLLLGYCQIFRWKD